ncbi:MAG TPA: phosphate signaling complex protein PhoU [Bacillus sp. (in: firmicutes)]|uniref:phosphate signaling complex protein PhoU n=1 Tax=Bacillus litorisediminis TaxID=2922713 RepID=UPI001FADF78C|nr:phosphate signaling complex protein PhoU [Bacillus litorisediminis]HWO77643.1 phosphate signaling complex protein PhoU [Bacillus sp. (in: firmicutes)]
MPVREQFEINLKELQDKLIQLGNFAKSALINALDALENQDVEKALEIMDEDVNADLLEDEINDTAILLIAKQQPVAIDLRRIIVAIKIASDLERMADFAVNIAKSTIRIGNQPLVKPIDSIKKMHESTIKMIELAIEGYYQEDLVKAKELADIDDVVDDLYGSTIQELLSLMQTQPENHSQITQLSFVCRYLERTADHATNIAEYIFYLVKGRRYDLNQ